MGMVSRTNAGVVCAAVEACGCCHGCSCGHVSSCRRRNAIIGNASIVHCAPDSTRCAGHDEAVSTQITLEEHGRVRAMLVVEAIGGNVGNSTRVCARAHTTRVRGIAHWVGRAHEEPTKEIFVLFNHAFETSAIYFLPQGPIVIIPLDTNAVAMDTIWWEQGKSGYRKKELHGGFRTRLKLKDGWVKGEASDPFELRSKHIWTCRRQHRQPKLHDGAAVNDGTRESLFWCNVGVPRRPRGGIDKSFGGGVLKTRRANFLSTLLHRGNLETDMKFSKTHQPRWTIIPTLKSSCLFM